MIGIILISHGEMANGMLHSASLFYGNQLKQIEALTLQANDSVDSFLLRLKDATQLVDKGEGVIILADMFGGTPCNKAISVMSKKVHVISGMNLSLLLELLGRRESGNVSLDECLQCAKDNMIHVNNAFE